MKAYLALDRFRAGAPFRPWLLTIVGNEARNRLRARGRREGLADRALAAIRGGATRATTDGSPRPAAAAASPELEVLVGETQAEVRAALRDLGDDERRVVACRYLLGLSESETCAALGIPAGTAKSRLHRGPAPDARVARGGRRDPGGRPVTGPGASDAMAIDAAVERLLVAAGREAAWPATPDLRTSVLARIEAPEAPDLRPGVLTRIDGVPARRGPAMRALRPLAIAAILVILVAGLAAGLGFSLPGLDLGRTEQTPAATTSPLDLGSPIPVADALAFDRPRVLLPAALPPPDEAYELGVDDRRIVSLAWRAAPGDPVLEGSDTFLTLMAVPGTTEEPLICEGRRPERRHRADRRQRRPRLVDHRRAARDHGPAAGRGHRRPARSRRRRHALVLARRDALPARVRARPGGDARDRALPPLTSQPAARRPRITEQRRASVGARRPEAPARTGSRRWLEAGPARIRGS